MEEGQSGKKEIRKEAVEVVNANEKQEEVKEDVQFLASAAGKMIVRFFDVGKRSMEISLGAGWNQEFDFY